MPSHNSKAGLNRSILNVGWCQIEQFICYKAKKVGKVVFKVPAHHTSQECADCGHTHPNNRKHQELFICVSCGHSDNADKNAAEVIRVLGRCMSKCNTSLFFEKRLHA